VEAAEIALVAAKMWAPFRHTHFPESLAPAYQLLMQIEHHRDSYSALLGSGPGILQSLHDYIKEDINYA
jgi:trans-aconitate methyltransferase